MYCLSRPWPKSILNCWFSAALCLDGPKVHSSTKRESVPRSLVIYHSVIFSASVAEILNSFFWGICLRWRPAYHPFCYPLFAIRTRGCRERQHPSFGDMCQLCAFPTLFYFFNIYRNFLINFGASVTPSVSPSRQDQDVSWALG